MQVDSSSSYDDEEAKMRRTMHISRAQDREDEERRMRARSSDAKDKRSYVKARPPTQVLGQDSEFCRSQSVQPTDKVLYRQSKRVEVIKQAYKRVKATIGSIKKTVKHIFKWF